MKAIIAPVSFAFLFMIAFAELSTPPKPATNQDIAMYALILALMIVGTKYDEPRK